MAKRKSIKKQQKKLNVMRDLDKYMDTTYDSLQEEIEAMQIRIYLADQKARKKAKKKLKRAKSGKKELNTVDIMNIKRKAREEVLDDMGKSNFLDRVFNFLNDLSPVVQIIAKLVEALICAILSMDVVKINISPNMMQKINTVYQKCHLLAKA